MKPMRRDYDNTDYCRRLHALFKPGNGVSPPVLAGREGELDTLSKRLDLLVCRDEVASDVVLYGPRGNGKTVLLREVERLAERAGADTLTLRPTQVPSALDLAKQLLYNDHDALGGLLGRLTPSTLSVSLPGLTSARWQAMSPSERAQANLERLFPLLAARCRERPLLVTLDEAHTLDIAVGQHLLNLSELVRGKARAPFLLILAGTPGLRDRLGSINATFWGRARKLGIGRLTPDATAQALARPLTNKNVEFDPDALDAVVEDCQGYPYFTQVWGQALCEALVERRAPRISLDIVARASPGVDREREDYFQDRYTEMENNDLLAAALVVGDVCARANERVDSRTLRAALVAAGAAPAESVATAQVRQLAMLGYLWRQPPGVDWEPGIPSLMRYVNEKTARFTPDEETGAAPPSGMSP